MNLNGKFGKKLGRPNGGPSRNLGLMAHPGRPYNHHWRALALPSK